MERTARGADSTRTRAWVVLLCAAALVLVVPAATSASSSRASGPASPDQSRPTITIATAAFGISFFPIYLAKTLGYYERAGVDVRFLDNAGANLTNYLAAGQADLGAIGVNGPLLLTLRGRPMKAIYAHTAGASGGCLVGRREIRNVTELKGKRIGHLGGGSSTQGFAQIYDRVFNLNANFVPFGTNPAMVAALTAGSIQAGVASCSFFQPLLDAGNARILINTRNAKVRHRYLGPDYPEGVIFGEPGNMASKRAAVTAVLQAIDLGLRYLRTHTPAEIASALRQYPGYAPTPADTLAGLVTADALVYDGPNNGWVTPQLWKLGLDSYGTWGLGIDPSANAISYNNFIDMSYLNTALNRNKLTLRGSIAPSGAVLLRNVSNLGAGRFAVTIADQSSTDGFFLKGPGVNKTTPVGARRTVTWQVTLGPGKYVYGSLTKKKNRDSFEVKGL